MAPTVQGGSYPTNAVFTPVRDVNYSIHQGRRKLTFRKQSRQGSFIPFHFHDKLDKLIKNKTKIALKLIFIDQSELSHRVYNFLKRSNIYTLFDLLNKSEVDLLRIEYFRPEDLYEVLDSLEKHFSIDLSKKKF
ncbi:DNA-directed RNA polymerase subunit alpha [Striga asiatica]|uniref:DNA-directed RNA polymerase subunit alpha n=1 Tax=Striga asiatica TaxID=4170 RepID=A0A5A7RJU4_STRAF|nr:DNA-directed RNA polymerase subunit alpha [Striga asiatica]